MPILHPPTGSSQLSSGASSVCPHGPHCLWCWFHGVLGPHTLACCLPLRANSRELMWFHSLWLELEAPRTLLRSVPMEHTFPAPSPLSRSLCCIVQGAWFPEAPESREWGWSTASSAGLLHSLSPGSPRRSQCPVLSTEER